MSTSKVRAKGASTQSCLRLFDPTEAPQSERPVDRLSPQMTLPAFHRDYFAPVVAKAKTLDSQTIAMYDHAVALWSQLTPNRSLDQIGDDDGADFVDGLRLLPGLREEFMSPRTVARHARNVQRILDCAAPRSRFTSYGKYGRGLIDSAPVIEPPQVPETFPTGIFTFDEVSAILKACDVMRRPRLPRDCKPATWWRALFRFLYYTGLRIRETMQLQGSMIDDQLLLLPYAITKGRKASRRKFLHADAHAAIAPLKGLSPFVFPWPSQAKSTGMRNLQRQRKRLVAMAGLPKARQFGFHGVRKLHATSLAANDEAAAQFSLGHASSQTTRSHYTHVDVTTANRLRREAEAIDQLQRLPG
ncbi:MAG: tyrosine-type recombinase/integrase [Planctomycetota bacterium]